MNTNEKLLPDSEVLARYLSGEMSVAEVQAFKDANAISKEELHRIDTMKKQWNAMKGYAEPKNIDTGKAWEKLHARLGEDKLIPNADLLGKKNIAPVYLRIAALIVVLIGISAVIYNSLDRKLGAEMVQLNTGHERNTLVKTLNDGSIIYLAQNSLFSFPKEFEQKSRNVALKGEAFFDIAPNPSKPFIIETEQAFIEVLGTAFNVKTQASYGFELCVDRGRVKVTLKSDPTHSQLVVAGEKVNTYQNNLVKSRNTLNPATAWYRQRMQFKDESLQNVISVLNRNFNTTIMVPEKETSKRKFTVTFTNESAETKIELICAILNLKRQTINGSVVLSDSKETTPQN
jgi:transmembrane sensor